MTRMALPHEGPQADIQMGTLSKGAGTYGGYVCGSKALVDYLQTSARSLIYSTGLPPCIVASAAAAVKLIASDPVLVAKPLSRARYFTEKMGMEEAESAIVPFILEDNEKTLAASEKLEEAGFLVWAIRPPTVPENSARLRFAFSALHEEKEIDRLVSVLKELGL